MTCPPCNHACRQSRDCPAPRPPLPRWVIRIRKAAFRVAFAVELAGAGAVDLAACYRLNRSWGYGRRESFRRAVAAAITQPTRS